MATAPTVTASGISYKIFPNRHTFSLHVDAPAGKVFMATGEHHYRDMCHAPVVLMSRVRDLESAGLADCPDRACPCHG